MPLTSVLSVQIRPEKQRRYEELAQQVAEAARAKDEQTRWTVHQTAFGELGSLHFVSNFENFTELGQQGLVPELIVRVLGETQAAKFMQEIEECSVAQRHEISTDRPDLSYQRDGGEREIAPAAMVTVVQAQAGQQDAVEELIRKLAEAIPKVGDPARMSCFQTVVGPLGRLWTVRPLQDLSELDDQKQPQELLEGAFGAAEGGLIYRSGLDAIEQARRSVMIYREDLSNPE